ncbi:MAG: hypothetical protein ACK5OC_27585 [Pirellula sp.]
MVDDAKRVYYERMQFTEECLGYQSHNRRRVERSGAATLPSSQNRNNRTDHPPTTGW